MTRDVFIIVLAGLLAGKTTVHDLYHWSLQVFPNNAPPKLDIAVLIKELSQDGLIEQFQPEHYKLGELWYQDASFSVDLSAFNPE